MDTEPFLDGVHSENPLQIYWINRFKWGDVPLNKNCVPISLRVFFNAFKPMFYGMGFVLMELSRI